MDISFVYSTMEKIKEIAKKLGEELQSSAWSEDEFDRLRRLSQLTEQLELAILELEPGGGLPRTVNNMSVIHIKTHLLDDIIIEHMWRVKDGDNPIAAAKMCKKAIIEKLEKKTIRKCGGCGRDVFENE